jgi:hypothetical protein
MTVEPLPALSATSLAEGVMTLQPRSSERVPRRRVGRTKEHKAMERTREQPLKEKDLPSNDRSIEKEGEKARQEMDEIPEPGTDPLHEGP